MAKIIMNIKNFAIIWRLIGEIFIFQFAKIGIKTIKQIYPNSRRLE
jgi:hypothetical protein